MIRDNIDSININYVFNCNLNASCERAGAVRTADSWHFDIFSYIKGRLLAEKYFGWDGEKYNQVALKITAKKNLNESRTTLKFFGFVIATGSSRDSSSKVPRDIILLEGTIGTGGSVKNWFTYCSKGSSFV